MPKEASLQDEMGLSGLPTDEKSANGDLQRLLEFSTMCHGSTLGGCCHGIWWRIQIASVHPLWAGFFAMGQSGQATFSRSKTPSDIFCLHIPHPLHDMTLLPHQACVALKRKPVARDTRAPRVSSIVGSFFPPPWQESVADSVAPAVCHLALVAA
jgi:hypothetical protein